MPEQTIPKMRVAVVATLDGPIVENSTGGTEIWTHAFVEELVRTGNNVELFGLRGSRTSAELVEVGDFSDLASIQGNTPEKEKLRLFSVKQAQLVASRSSEFDIIHVSAYQLQHYLPALSRVGTPVVVTVHGSPLPADETQRLIKDYSGLQFVFISESSARHLAGYTGRNVIYNGIDISKFPYSDDASDKLFWIGRLTSVKGAGEAIEVANMAKVPLILAGSIRDQEYFTLNIKPRLNDKVVFVGELSFAEKVKYYQQARALLMPINWEEPFGLVAVEAMACGTPVVAYRRGALPEIIADGRNGYLIDANDSESMARCVKSITAMPAERYKQLRAECRSRVEDKFTLKEMVEKYLSLYTKLITK